MVKPPKHTSCNSVSNREGENCYLYALPYYTHIMTDFLEELVVSNDSFISLHMTIADLCDESRFTYQQISTIVEHSDLGDKLLYSMFILDSQGTGFLSIRKIAGVFKLSGI